MYRRDPAHGPLAQTHEIEGVRKPTMPSVVTQRARVASLADALALVVVCQVIQGLAYQVVGIRVGNDLLAEIVELLQLGVVLDHVERATHRRFEVAQPDLVQALSSSAVVDAR